MVKAKTIKSIELFSGAGGLALGLEIAGFEHRALVEWDHDSCNTLRLNKGNDHGWPVHEIDARKFDYKAIAGRVDFVAGGPPCQPFSLGGKHGGHLDERDMFPEAVRSIRDLAPKAFLFENVKGLTRPSFAKYFEYVFLQLSHPSLVIKGGETWLDHLSRLENHHTKGSSSGLEYNVVFRLLNTADYGVPQTRTRVVFVGFRNDLGVEWSFPKPTHSYQGLLRSQAVTKEYWERHGISKKRREIIPVMRNFSTKLAFEDVEKAQSLLPWRTVRDALCNLPKPEKSNPQSSPEIANHVYISGAKSYPGHTGSSLDFPSKTIKAGDHGVPGGENMMLYPNGKVRYFSVREAARIQTFPDDYIISGSWTESMRQLGNAVPVEFAQILGKQVIARL